jgi:hypothetical protein
MRVQYSNRLNHDHGTPHQPQYTSTRLQIKNPRIQAWLKLDYCLQWSRGRGELLAITRPPILSLNVYGLVVEASRYKMARQPIALGLTATEPTTTFTT